MSLNNTLDTLIEENLTCVCMRARAMMPLIMTCLLLMACISGTGKNLNEAPESSYVGPTSTTTSWGVSYDWAHFEGDFENMTDVDASGAVLWGDPLLVQHGCRGAHDLPIGHPRAGSGANHLYCRSTSMHQPRERR